MMRLFIRIKDGQPFEHPIIEWNFKQAFPSLDMDNLPPDFANFVRVPRPNPDPNKYIVSATCSYQWVGDKVYDVWDVVQADVPVEEDLIAGPLE